MKIIPLKLPEGGERPGILARVDLNGVQLSILTIHPRAPIRHGHFELRNQMLQAGAMYARRLNDPKILVGDLNTTMWSRHFRDLIDLSGLKSGREGFQVLPSWPTFLRFRWLMIPIDHCLVSRGVRATKVATGQRIGSDHLPLIVELKISNSELRNGSA